MTAQRYSYPLVDALRGVAALMVLTYHVIEMGVWTTFPTQGGLAVFRYGWVGVNLFLVISGFVIGLTALREFDLNGPAFRRPFIVHRLARVVPLYLFTGLVYVFLVESSVFDRPAPRLFAHIASHLLFLHNLHPSTSGSINGPNWSVALEMQFYLVMVWLTPWLARIPAWGMLGGAIVLAAVYRWTTSWLLPHGSVDIHTQHVAATQLPGVLEHFAAGIFMARAMRGEAGIWWKDRMSGSWRNALSLGLASCALLSGAAWLLRSFSYWDRAPMIAFVPTLLAAGMAALVAAVAVVPAQRLRALAPMRYLGTVSYGIYLWHVPVILSILQRYPTLAKEKLLASVLLSVLLLAMFSWHFLEKPNIQRFKTQ